MRTNVASPPGSGRARGILGTRRAWKAEADRTGGSGIRVEIIVTPGAAAAGMFAELAALTDRQDGRRTGADRRDLRARRHRLPA